MKRLTLVLLALLLPMLSGCRAEESPPWDSETEYFSDTSAEDCYLCGGGIENLVSSYWGQKNLAFVSLNTFEIVPLEINRYDKIDGHLIEEYVGTTYFGGGSGADGGFSTRLLINCDRGIAGGALDFYNDETLDMDKAASFLCADCLEKIIKSADGPCFGVGMIDLETKNFHILGKRLGGFPLGDYYTFCELQEQKNNHPLQMELLIIYCPRRYATVREPALNE